MSGGLPVSVALVRQAVSSVVRIHAYGTTVDYMEPFSRGKGGKGVGTGFVVRLSDAGEWDRHYRFILTCAHCVQGCEWNKVRIVLPKHSQAERSAMVVSVCPEVDLALVAMPVASLAKELEGEGLNVDDVISPGGITLDPSIPEMGTPVYAVGYPLGEGITATGGNFSSFEQGKLKHSAPITHGSSGGPLLRLEGGDARCIGVNSSGIPSVSNTGFAVPIRMFLNVAAEMMRKINLPDPMSVARVIRMPGVGVQTHNGLGSLTAEGGGVLGGGGVGEGVVVYYVHRSSSFRGALRRGDVLTGVAMWARPGATCDANYVDKGDGTCETCGEPRAQHNNVCGQFEAAVDRGSGCKTCHLDRVRHRVSVDHLGQVAAGGTFVQRLPLSDYLRLQDAFTMVSEEDAQVDRAAGDATDAETATEASTPFHAMIDWRHGACRKLYAPYDPIDYLLVMGMCLTQLRLNHVDSPAGIQTLGALDPWDLDRERVIVSHVFPGTTVAQQGAMAPGSMIRRVNGCSVRTLWDIRRALYDALAREDDDKALGDDGRIVVEVETTHGMRVTMRVTRLLREERAMFADGTYGDGKPDGARILVPEAVDAIVRAVKDDLDEVSQAAGGDFDVRKTHDYDVAMQWIARNANRAGSTGRFTAYAAAPKLADVIAGRVVKAVPSTVEAPKLADVIAGRVVKAVPSPVEAMTKLLDGLERAAITGRNSVGRGNSDV
jgi:S1-C subfamily serine protease